MSDIGMSNAGAAVVLAPARPPGRKGDRDPLLRLLALTRPAWPRLALAVLTGFGTLACGIGLLTTAAWLISRAAQHPPVLAAVVGASATARSTRSFTEIFCGDTSLSRRRRSISASSRAVRFT